MARNPKPVRKKYRRPPCEWRYWKRRALKAAEPWGMFEEVTESFEMHRKDRDSTPYQCYFWACYDWDL